LNYLPVLLLRLPAPSTVVRLFPDQRVMPSSFLFFPEPKSTFPEQ